MTKPQLVLQVTNTERLFEVLLGDTVLLTLSNTEPDDENALALLAKAATKPFEVLPLLSLNVSFTFLFWLAKTLMRKQFQFAVSIRLRFIRFLLDLGFVRLRHYFHVI